MLPLITTLPLREEGILHHPKYDSKEHKNLFPQGLGQNICNLLIYGNILKLHCSFLDPIPDEVIYDLNMLGHVMEYWILKYFDTTLIIGVYHRKPQLLIK
jgi:hypothetical protein